MPSGEQVLCPEGHLYQLLYYHIRVSAIWFAGLYSATLGSTPSRLVMSCESMHTALSCCLVLSCESVHTAQHTHDMPCSAAPSCCAVSATCWAAHCMVVSYLCRCM